MAFISNYLLKSKSSLKDLPKVVEKLTQTTIQESRQLITKHVTSGPNWISPDPMGTLLHIDKAFDRTKVIAQS